MVVWWVVSDSYKMHFVSCQNQCGWKWLNVVIINIFFQRLIQVNITLEVGPPEIAHQEGITQGSIELCAEQAELNLRSTSFAEMDSLNTIPGNSDCPILTRQYGVEDTKGFYCQLNKTDISKGQITVCGEYLFHFRFEVYTHYSRSGGPYL